MSGSKKILLVCAGILFQQTSALAIPEGDLKESYQSIVDRNPFGLKPPAPPPTNAPPPEVKAKSEIFLTGIVSVGYPRLPKRAYLMTREQGQKDPTYYELTESESQNGISVLQIDEKNRTVKIKADGNETLLSFQTHGIAAPVAAAAPPQPAAGGRPGAPGQHPANLQPGQHAMQPLPVPGGAAAATPNYAGQPFANARPATTRQIPSRSVRVRTPVDSSPDVPAGTPPPLNTPQEEQYEDPALQYIRLKAEEARNRQLGIPTPPIPPP